MDNFIFGLATFTIGAFATIINVQRRTINKLRDSLKSHKRQNELIQERIYKLIWERNRREKESGVSES